MSLGWFFEVAFLVAGTGYNRPNRYLNSTIVLFDNDNHEDFMHINDIIRTAVHLKLH